MTFSVDVSAVLSGTRLSALAGPLNELTGQVLKGNLHGDEAKWLSAIAGLPKLSASYTRYDLPVVKIGEPTLCSDFQRQQIEQSLMQLHPWRKGPFELFGLVLDSEWRSDWKWERVSSHMADLSGRVVLDVGCGNGYYLFRLLGAGAEAAIGIDPTRLFLAQFQAIKQYAPNSRAEVLPLKSEQLPLTLFEQSTALTFDTVMSMGVLYHRKAPLEHLAELFTALRSGGEMVLETLIVEDDESLFPRPRYAKMRNVWQVHCLADLLELIDQAGFVNSRVVDVTATRTEEQRATPWMSFESLSDFLNPDNPDLTIEGYPSPVRATIIAEKPT